METTDLNESCECIQKESPAELQSIFPNLLLFLCCALDIFSSILHIKRENFVTALWNQEGNNAHFIVTGHKLNESKDHSVMTGKMEDSSSSL